MKKGPKQDPEKDFRKVKECIYRLNKKTYLHNEDAQLCKFLYKSVQNLQFDERPDAYAVIDDTLLLIEHFTFDNSKIQDNAGSDLRRIQSENNRKIDKKLNEMPFSKIHENIEVRGIVVEKESVDQSSDYYVDNLTKQFQKHAGKIPDYKAHITQKYSQPFHKIIMGFVIEEINTFGSTFVENGQQYIVDLRQTKEFLDLFENQRDLDFVLYTISLHNNDVYQSFVSKKTLSLYREEQYEVKSKTLICEDTTVLAADIRFKGEHHAK